MDKTPGQVVVGRHAVAEALQNAPKRAQELLLASTSGGAALARILDMARAAGVKVRRVERRDLEDLAGGAAHQGLGLRLAAAEYVDFSQVLQAARQAGPAGLLLMADHIQDPHNLGALARSAAAAGAQGLVVPKNRACPFTPAVAKAAAGALERLPVCRVTNLTNSLEECKEVGLWSLAATTQGHSAPWELSLNLPLVLVVGGEHKGVGARLMGACDLLTSLPLALGVESLNASVAAGILLFEIVRQRHAAI